MFVLAFASCFALPAMAQMFDGDNGNMRPERLALIIGVPTYQENFPPLPGVQNDVMAMKAALQKIGVANPKVVLPSDSQPFVLRKDIYQALRSFWRDAQFSAKTRGVPPVLIFYFAGHGFSFDSSSYIVPGDAYITNSEDPDRHAIRVSDVISTMQGAKPLLSVVIIDACREFAFANLAPLNGDGPATPVTKGSDGNKSLPIGPSAGSLLLYYSTAEGGVAADVSKANSVNGPYAFALTKAINEQSQAAPPGAPTASPRFLTDLTEEVNDAVASLTRDVRPQRPALVNNALYKLPLITTQAQFKSEEAVFDGFKTLIDRRSADLINKYGMVGAVALIGQYEACYYSEFIKRFGISYFWRAAAAKVGSKDTTNCEAGLTSIGLSAPGQLSNVAPSGDVASSQVRSPATAVLDTRVQSALDELKSKPALVLATPPAPSTAPSPVTPTGATAPPPPSSPASVPVAAPPPAGLARDARVATVQTALNPPRNAKMLVVKQTNMDQPAYPGGRVVPLPAGSIVDFLKFDDAKPGRSYVWHGMHGYGFIATADLTSVQGVLQMTFEIDSTGAGLKPAQVTYLRDRLGQLVGAAGEISAVSIRYSVDAGAHGLAVALSIATLADDAAAHKIQYLPQIVPSTELKPEFVEFVAAVQLCTDQASGSICTLPEGMQSKTAAEVLVGDDAASNNAKAISATRIPVLPAVLGNRPQ